MVRLIGKDPDPGKDWGLEEKGMTQDEMTGWHHWLNGHDFEPTLGDREGQGGLICCSPWSHKEWDTTDQLNNKEYQMLKTRFKPGFSYTPCEFSWSSWVIFLENFANPSSVYSITFSNFVIVSPLFSPRGSLHFCATELPHKSEDQGKRQKIFWSL